MSENSDEKSRSAVGGDSDVAADRDELGFGPYVAAIKRFLTDPDTQPPITMSIEGEWGAGKSTFLNLLANELDEEDQDHIVVEFNPWRYDNEESLWAAFALKLLTDIETTQCGVVKYKNRLKLSLKRFNQHTSLIEKLKTIIVGFAIVSAASVVGIWGGTILSTLGNFSADSTLFRILAGSSGAAVTFVALLNVLGHLKTPFLGTLARDLREYTSSPEYERRIPLIEHFHEDLSSVLDAYLNENQRVIILIDDLDRCAAPRAAELMQSINLLIGRDERLVFVVAMDRKRVAAGIASKYSEILPLIQDSNNNFQTDGVDSDHSQLKFGYNFIEKFVQVPFQVPRPSTGSIKNFLKDEEIEETSDYSDLFPSDDELNIEDEVIDSELMEKIAVVLDTNPRQAVRFRNLLSLRVLQTASEEMLEHHDTEEEISLQQLAKFVAISTEYPELVARIQRNPDLLSNLEYYAVNDEELEGDSSLRPWVSNGKLLELLAYGDNKSGNYQLPADIVRNLVRLSPAEHSHPLQQFGDPEVGYPYNNIDAGENIEQFREVLPERYFNIVLDSTYLVESLDHEMMEQSNLRSKREQLAEKYGNNAYYISSLTLAGYFSEDSAFATLLQNLEESPEYDDNEYQKIFKSIIDDRILCLFINSTDAVGDIKLKIEETAKNHENSNIPLDWFDIRASGSQQMERLERSIQELQDEWGDVEYNISIDSKEMSARLYVPSLNIP